MKRRTQKFYTVWVGRTTGVFDTWLDCYLQTHQFEGALFKAFPTQEEAEVAYSSSYKEYIGKNINEEDSNDEITVSHPINESIFVQTSYNPNTDSYEYVGKSVQYGTVLFKYACLKKATSNIASFLAVVHALAFNALNGLNLAVYTDNVYALRWAQRKAMSTTLERTADTEHIYRLTHRALTWLKNNEYQNLYKWETKVWGHTPVTFGTTRQL